MNIDAALKKLFSLHQFGVKLGLDNITKFLSYLGNPHKNLKCFHIAGSNGKGSTASFLASMLIENGYRVGLFTSPHLVNYNERISINGEFIDDKYLSEFLTSSVSYIDKNKPTFFEVTTALAFKYFAENKVDFAVIEVGLGGRLDATNVIVPLASIITSISKEHSHILGEELEEIAIEKGGIIKNNVPVYIGKMTQSVEKILKDIAIKKNSELTGIKKYIKYENDYLNFEIEGHHLNLYQTPLKGKYQLYNAALALLVFLKEINNAKIGSVIRGIDNVIGNSGIQGRYEVVNEYPKIILDAAHNPDSIKAFVSEFVNEELNFKKKYLIFGAMRDKNISKMLIILQDYFDNILLTSIKYERAATVNELKIICEKLNISAEILNNRKKFIDNFKKEYQQDCLVILGSIFLLGEVKRNKEI